MSQGARVRMPVDERRKALAHAALRVLSRDGLEAATTRAIVSEAGMSLASLHYAFPSRDALLKEVVALVVDDEREAIEHALDDAEAAGRGKEALARVVREGLGRYLATIEQHPGREHGMLELTLQASRGEGLGDVAAWQYAQYRELVAGLLAAAAQATGMRWTHDLDELAATAVVMTDGLTIARIVEGTVPDAALDDLTATLVGHAEEVA